MLPSQQFEPVRRESSRPLFRQQQEQDQRTLRSLENLAQNREHILRWATNSMVIEDVIAFSVIEYG